MKTKVKIETEVDLKLLIVKAGVRYWEDATVNGTPDEDGNLIPCRQGGLWCPIIDIDSGVILNWTQGTTADIHYKVADNGSYYIQDSDGRIVLSIEDDYVPKIMCPKEHGYGDYIIMNVDADGKIKHWFQTLEGFDGGYVGMIR